MEEVKKAKDQAEKVKEEAEKARGEAEQEGYDIGVAETEEALRVEVLGVCRIYCAKYGMKPSTKLGLRLLLFLGRQKVSSTPQLFVPPLQAAPR